MFLKKKRPNMVLLILTLINPWPDLFKSLDSIKTRFELPKVYFFKINEKSWKMLQTM